MKKTLLVIACALTLGYSNTFAQSCTPNLPSDGVHSHIVPDTIVNLPHATVGIAYSEDIQFYVGTDTMVTTPITCNLHITNFTLDSISGLPPGFSYTTNPANGIFPGGTSACLNLTSGPPAVGLIGTYPLLVYVTANLTCNGFPITQKPVFRGYKLIIDASTVSIADDLDMNKFQLSQNIPNPSNTSTRISFTTPVSEKMELNVFNAVGQLVLKQTVNGEKGTNDITISTAELADGMYIYTLRNATTTLSNRMVVSKK